MPNPIHQYQQKVKLILCGLKKPTLLNQRKAKPSLHLPYIVAKRLKNVGKSIFIIKYRGINTCS